jgi:hypothetical protein
VPGSDQTLLHRRSDPVASDFGIPDALRGDFSGRRRRNWIFFSGGDSFFLWDRAEFDRIHLIWPMMAMKARIPTVGFRSGPDPGPGMDRLSRRGSRVGSIAPRCFGAHDVAGSIAPRRFDAHDVAGGIAPRRFDAHDVVGGIAPRRFGAHDVVGSIAPRRFGANDVVGGIAARRFGAHDVVGGIAPRRFGAHDVVGGIAPRCFFLFLISFGRAWSSSDSNRRSH